MKNSFIIADFDLLILAYKNAPDYNTKLELLQLIEVNTQDEKTKLQATFCIAYEKESFKRFISVEDNCIYEIKVSETPKTCEDSFFVKTFEGIRSAVEIYCAFYKIDTSKMRIFVTKRKLMDNETFEDNSIGWRGDATYSGNFVLFDVSYDYDETSDYSLPVKNCGNKWNCEECKSYPCLIQKAPTLPTFFNNFDVVRYIENDGAVRYSVLFGDMQTDENDDCAYLVRLYDKTLCDKKVKTREQWFFDIISGFHEHIEFPRLEVIEIKNAPADIQKVYKTYKKLYDRFINAAE